MSFQTLVSQLSSLSAKTDVVRGLYILNDLEFVYKSMTSMGLGCNEEIIQNYSHACLKSSYETGTVRVSFKANGIVAIEADNDYGRNLDREVSLAQPEFTQLLWQAHSIASSL